jgi:membrane protein
MSPGGTLAFLVTEGISESDLSGCMEALRGTGLNVEIIRAKRSDEGTSGQPASGPERDLDRVSTSSYCALAIPGCVVPPEDMTAEAGALRFIQSMQAAGKPVIYVPLPARAAAKQGRTTSPPPFSLKKLFAESLHSWLAIDAPRLGAALAYYTLLSLAPLMVLIVSVTSLFFKRTIVQSGLVEQVRQVMGDTGAGIVTSVLEHAKLSTGVIAGAIGILMLLVGASGVFLELRDSLDAVWGVTPQYGSGVFSLIRERAFAFLMIIGAGILLSLNLLMSAVLATPVRFLMHILPDQNLVTASVAITVTLVTMTVLFALVYKTIPDIYIRWSDVWIGALVTAVLFTLGKAVIAIYIATAAIGSPYAAAGSLVIFLTWVYYSAQIFLLGAEFTHVYALRHGSYSKCPKWKSWCGFRATPQSQTPPVL